MNRTLTWLHLSDLHARLRDDWDSRQITGSLIRDLKTMQREHSLRPDFVFFTGDLAFGTVGRESMVDQYQLVRSFFDAVRTAFNPEIPLRDLFLVPGNHDVDRDEILPEQTEWLRHPDRQQHEILAAMRDEKKQWRVWMDRLVNYRNFLTSYGLLHLTPDDPHLVWADAREIHGSRIGIIGLNSAWSCANNEDKAKLWFGTDWQIARVKQIMGPVDFAFALIHHPGNWFTEREDPAAMRRLRQEFPIVLHGHEHQEWVEADAEGRLVLSAGACYESSWMSNGYSFGQIDLDQKQGSVWLRQWESIGRGWVPRNIWGKTQDDRWPLRNLSWIKNPTIETVAGSAESVSFEDDPPPAPGESAEEHYTRRYCRHVIDQHDRLELFGCDIPRALQSHQLSVAYVSLNLAHDDDDELLSLVPSKRDLKPSKRLADAEDDEKPQKGIGDSSAAVEFILDEVSDSTGRLLINGPAGAGKSTLMRWCAIHAAQQVLDSPSSPLPTFTRSRNPKNPTAGNRCNDDGLPGISGTWRRKIPLLIRLRDCPTGRLPAANELPGFLAKHLPSAPSNWMTDVLDSGQALVLFDGVDEIHRDQRRQLAEEIGELIRTYPNCTYVVTTRPGAVEPGWLARLEFTEARVEPMSRQDREEFIDKWYRSAALELKQRPRPGENLILTASRLKAELAEQPELGVLATNPLLCAMICALYRERQEKLPETPAELSEALCHMLLHRRERETPGLADKHFLSTWRALQYPQKKGLLAELAWYMVSRGDSSIETATAQTLAAEGLASTPGRTRDEAADVVQALVERSGLLRPASDSRIDFLHNTLKEYLAAGRVVEEGNWKILAEHADDPAWQPVILFTLALAPEPFSSALVGQLLTHIVPANTPTKRSGNLTKNERKALATDKARQFFLVRCRAVAKRLAADLSDTIDAFLESLLPPASMNEVEALVQLGPRILSYGKATLENGDWWARQSCPMVARCLRLLRLIGGPQAKAALKAIRGLPSYSSQVTNEWLLACGELSPEERVPWPFYYKEITHLYLSSPAINDISRLGDLISLRHLDLGGTAVTSLSPLTELKLLRSLTLQRTLVSDLTPLSELISLQSLNVGGTQVNDLSPLSRMISLKRLVCWYTKVGDLKSIAELAALEYLDIDRTYVTDLSPLIRMVSLQVLSLENTEVTDLSPLEGLVSLQNLNLCMTPVTDLGPLSRMSLLQRLSLWETKVIDLSPLVGLVSLQHLDLDETLVTDLRPLSRLVSLEHLHLSGTQATDLSPLRSLISLKYLNLSGTQVIDLSLLTSLESLNWLILNETQITDLRPLTRIASLKHISVKNAAVSEQDLENFKTLRPDVNIFR
jgi:hypothetical protein